MEEKKYAVGIDIGGTNTVFALIDADGKIYTRSRISTSGVTAEAYADALAQAVKEMLAQSGIGKEMITGVGVGAPCADFRSGCIEASTELPWPSPIPIGQMLAQRLAMPVAVSNDANAAAVGEMIYGAAKGMEDFMMITLGTGVGSGIVCGRHLITGSRGFAGELGHCRVAGMEHDTRMCNCGRPDCLQTYCSASGVVTTALQMRERHGLPTLATLTAKEVGESAVNGEEWALDTFRYTGRVLGRACAEFATFSDPEAVVLFGGVANAFPYLEPSMRQALEENTLSLYRNHIKILKSGLPEADAALLGAAALVFV